MIALLWAKVWKYVVAFGAVLAAIAAIFYEGRSKGVASQQIKVEKAKDEAAVATATTEQLESRHATDTAVARLPEAAPGVSLGNAPPDTSAGKLSDWAD